MLLFPCLTWNFETLKRKYLHNDANFLLPVLRTWRLEFNLKTSWTIPIRKFPLRNDILRKYMIGRDAYHCPSEMSFITTLLSVLHRIRCDNIMIENAMQR